MSESQKHLDDLSQIRSMMERSSRFISLSGLAGIFAGTFAIAGALFALFQLTGSYNALNYMERIPINLTVDTAFFLLLDALMVLVLSISAAVFFTTKKAKKKGLPLWDAKAFRMLANLAIPLVAGGVFCLTLLYHSLHAGREAYYLFGLIAPCTLLFYGLALLNASNYTLDEIRWLGVSEIILGLFACIFVGNGLLFWIIGFGFLHIFYGALMWYKYER